MSQLVTKKAEPVGHPSIASSAMLEVSGLTVSGAAPEEPERTILDDVSFSIARGEVLGVLGESGAGKSTLALSLLRLLPNQFRICSGTIRLNGQLLSDLPEREMRSVRGKGLSLVYQDSSVLNPVLRAEDQVYEVVRAHTDASEAGCREEAREALAMVGLGERRFQSAYPHQLSGGQKQRVAIAQALACKPQVLIADEPTASLDAVTTLEILNLFEQVKLGGQTSVLLISHQPEILSYLADRAMVLYSGEVIEEGPARKIFGSPLHPYTRELLRCKSPLEGSDAQVGAKLFWPTIPGEADGIRTPSSCGFEKRCFQRAEICATCSPAMYRANSAHVVRCFQFSEAGI